MFAPPPTSIIPPTKHSSSPPARIKICLLGLWSHPRFARPPSQSDRMKGYGTAGALTHADPLFVRRFSTIELVCSLFCFFFFFSYVSQARFCSAAAAWANQRWPFGLSDGRSPLVLRVPEPGAGCGSAVSERRTGGRHLHWKAFSWRSDHSCNVFSSES